MVLTHLSSWNAKPAWRREVSITQKIENLCPQLQDYKTYLLSEICFTKIFLIDNTIESAYEELINLFIGNNSVNRLSALHNIPCLMQLRVLCLMCSWAVFIWKFLAVFGSTVEISILRRLSLQDPQVKFWSWLVNSYSSQDFTYSLESAIWY